MEKRQFVTISFFFSLCPEFLSRPYSYSRGFFTESDSFPSRFFSVRHFFFFGDSRPINAHVASSFHFPLAISLEELLCDSYCMGEEST